MKAVFFPIVLGFLHLSVCAQAQFKPQEPNWTHTAALATIDREGSRQVLARLFDLARQERSTDLLRELEAVEARTDWPVPAREYVLHTFAVGLGDLPSWPDASRVTDQLMAYSIQTLVPDEHHPNRGVPLFNIRAAASGTAMEWRRQAAWSEAQRLFREGGKAWVDAYLAAGMPERRGFTEALESANPDALQEIAAVSLVAMEKEPALSSLAARAGLELGDPVLFQQALMRGDDAGTADLLRAASKKFDTNETESLLRLTVNHANPELAALAIAILAPKLMKYPDVSALMIDTLEHRELGAAAALALSKSDDPNVQQQLTELVKRNKGLASQRAAIALSDEAAAAAEELQ